MRNVASECSVPFESNMLRRLAASVVLSATCVDDSICEKTGGGKCTDIGTDAISKFEVTIVLRGTEDELRIVPASVSVAGSVAFTINGMASSAIVD